MVKHIILSTLKEMSDSEKESVKAESKKGLEGLKGKIPGLVDIKVNTSGRLPSSTADLMLDSTFESEEALKGYSKHPEHVLVADSKVRPFTASRACLDFEIKTRFKMKLFGLADRCDYKLRSKALTQPFLRVILIITHSI